MIASLYLKILIVLQLSAILTCGSNGRIKMVESLMNFCKHNGKVNLVITSFYEDSANVTLLMKTTFEYSVKKGMMPARVIPTQTLLANTENFTDLIDYERELLILISSTSNIFNLKRDFEVISKTRIMSSVLMMVEPLTSENFSSIDDMLKDFINSAYFYMLSEEIYGQNNNIIWKEVLTLKRYQQTVIRNLNFDTIGRVVANHDMQGIHIKCYTLSWAPYLTLSNCIQPNQTSCESVGYLADVMNNLGTMFNFTWDCDKDPDENWGVLPISGNSAT